MDCVEVCPVDCFYEGDNMLVIHPDECIDCGVCEPECPVDAIRPDTEPGLDQWLSLNAEYANQWPNITIKRDAAAGRGGIRDGRRQVREVSSRRRPARATETAGSNLHAVLQAESCFDALKGRDAQRVSRQIVQRNPRELLPRIFMLIL